MMNRENMPLYVIGALAVLLVGLVAVLMLRRPAPETTSPSGGMPANVAEEFNRRMRGAGGAGPPGGTATTPPGGAALPGTPPGIPTGPPGR